MTRKEVLRQRQAEWRKKHPTYYRDKGRARRAKDPVAYAAWQRRLMMKTLYGITVEDYDKMFKAQRGRCAICRTTEVGQTTKKNFCVDHDHKTGKVRGLLCFRCNRALGLFYDKAHVVAKAAEYLRRE